jgi:hypothetical protein
VQTLDINVDGGLGECPHFEVYDDAEPLVRPEHDLEEALDTSSRPTGIRE